MTAIVRRYVLALALLALPFLQDARAQTKASSSLPVVRATALAPMDIRSPLTPLPRQEGAAAAIVRDTLRNFTRGNTVFRIPASAVIDGSTGWVHGTNSFEDRSKATRITLPSGAQNVTVEEVFVTFVHKADRVTSEPYTIALRTVNATTGAPGSLLGAQTFSFSFVDADEDLGTPAFTTIHQFDTPIAVSDAFFIIVDFGTYGTAAYENAAIASSDFLGRFVEEDWEQLGNGDWINMSESWFAEANDGWEMWLEAVVNFDTGGGAPPVIAHTPPAAVPAGQDLTISANITGSSAIALALMTYAPGGSTSTPPILPMTNTGGTTWEAVIPAADVDLRGLRYAIGAADATGASSNTPDFNLRVSDDAGLTRSLSTSGTASTAYRLFSIPVALDNASPAAVLEDDLGSYDPAQWRLFGLRADQAYAEFPSSGAMTPGAAFWLASSESGREVDTGPATSVSLAEEYAIPLNPGWTFVGTPFNFPVNQQQVRLASGAALDIRTFNGSWTALSGPLQPFTGYAVAALASDQLRIAPFAGDVLARATTPPEADPHTTRPSRTTASASSEIDWRIHIAARAQGLEDADNYAILGPSADRRWDALDRPEPPVIGDYISLYFGHPDWGLPFRRFSTDARPLDAGMATWSFELSTSLAGPVDLTFGGLDGVPPAYAVWLVDRLQNRSINLRAQPHYRVAGSTEPYPDRFALLVGDPAALARTLQSTREVPETLSIENYPNPFRTETTLRFGLPHDDLVTLRVFDMLGKEVTTLLSEQPADRGYHTVVWNGLNRAGQPVRSGLYLYVLDTAGARVSGRVVVLR